MFDFLTEKFSHAFSFITGQKKLTEKNISLVVQKISDALIDADVPYKTVQVFIDSIHKEVVGTKILQSLKPDEQFAKIVHDKLVSFLGSDGSVDLHTPSILLLMGLQGSGKTTTVAKIAHVFKQNSKKTVHILLGTVDFYRPAAVEQLSVLAQKIGADFYMPESKDPIKEAENFILYAHKKSYDVIILDTAGRMHVDQNMLSELRQVVDRVKPTYKLLVIDIMTGQESLHVARSFNQAVGFDGAILTKIDSNSKGGVAFAFRYEMQKPIWFIGTGEKVEDLEIFRGDRFASRLMDMGDLDSLVERAQKKIDEQEALLLEKALEKGEMTIKTFGLQLRAMGKLGSMGSWVKYIPGVQGMRMTPEKIAESEKEAKIALAIIDSMTPKERLNHLLINSSRKKRIAKGAGIKGIEIDKFMRKFEEMQQFVKLLHNMGGNKFFK